MITFYFVIRKSNQDGGLHYYSMNHYYASVNLKSIIQVN
jgi:hypothetical protein